MDLASPNVSALADEHRGAGHAGGAESKADAPGGGGRETEAPLATQKELAPRPLAGRVALVTGGTSGIGLATVRGLLRNGARVIVLGQSQDKIDALRREFPNMPEPFAIPIDVRDREALEALATTLRRDRIHLDIVVPNAGINVRVPFLDLADAAVRRILDTNLLGVVLTLQVLAPLALDRPGARFVVTGSLAAIQGYDVRAVYTASKAALTGLVRSLAIEWGRFGATVNAVGPGIIRTALIEQYMHEYPERHAAALAHIPLGRLGEPEEIADVVLFLASPAARYISGQTIYIDGGLSAGHHWW